MPPDSLVHEILRRPGTLTFPSNLTDLPHLTAVAGSVSQQPTGHLVVYGSHGRRLCATDPDGHPLHECEWGPVDGALRLLRARVHLDWGAWVGLTPSGLVNTMTLDLSRKPGWQRLRADDLRGMAAQAMRVPLEEVRFFYNDQDVTIGATGAATIRHRKDAIYFLAGRDVRFQAIHGMYGSHALGGDRLSSGGGAVSLAAARHRVGAV
jgi:hypothetical protein